MQWVNHLPMEGKKKMSAAFPIGLELETLQLDQQLATASKTRNLSLNRGDLTRSSNQNLLETLLMEPFEKMVTRYLP